MMDSSLELQESGWEELRKEARKIERDLENKLSSYAKLAARFTHTSGIAESGPPNIGPNRSWKSTEMEIESLIEKLLVINDSMSRCAASASSTTSVTQKLAWHRDKIHEYSQLLANMWCSKVSLKRVSLKQKASACTCLKEFRRTKLNLNSLREHAELLNSVRDDITESKASGSMSPRVHLLRERASIHGSISHIDEVINQAQATRSVLGTQRAFFGQVQGKVKQLGDRFPKIRGLLGAIRRKRSKDTLILSAVIAACTLFLIIYWLSK